MLIHASGKINFDPMAKVVSARILHCKLTIFFLCKYEIFRGRECKSI